MKLLALFATAAAGVSALDVSPVQKVIQLIGELKVKVQKDLQNEEKAMAEYTTFCDDESSEKGYAIKTASRQIDGFNAVIEDMTGQIQDAQSSAQTAAQEMASKNGELKSGTNVRDNEHADF